jgi:hypothetical protein
MAERVRASEHWQDLAQSPVWVKVETSGPVSSTITSLLFWLGVNFERWVK